MRGNKQLINVQYTDGKVSRVPRLTADELVAIGKANFVSNTVWRASKAGVKIQKGQSDADVKEAIRATTTKAKEKSEDATHQEADTKQRRKRTKKRSGK